jgi:2-polyprenyl-6-methoxyphenol hydroxylase-like FAD-dependent oxidoreductase
VQFMNEYSVLISGAGIAGPALAHWLHRQGIRSTIVERAPDLRDGGQAVDLRGLGKVVAQQMGIMPRVRERIVHEKGLRYVDCAGRELATIPADLFTGDGSPVTEIEIMKGDLTVILHELIEDHTDIIYGDCITEISDGADGVTVTFRSGLERTFDIVVGADGIHSGVRSLVFGPESDFVVHLGAYLGYCTVPDPGALDSWFDMYSEPGRTLGIRPDRGGTARAMLAFVDTGINVDRRDIASQKRLLREVFAGMGWRSEELLAAADADEQFHLDTVSQVHMKEWTRGRVALLGDAGYCGSPLTGMGTSLALVGAYVLAGELGRVRRNHAEAFARYEQIMRPYVKAAHTLPPGGVHGFLPRGRFMLKIRVLSVRMMHHWPLRQLVARMLDNSKAIALPDYDADIAGASTCDHRARSVIGTPAHSAKRALFDGENKS